MQTNKLFSFSYKRFCGLCGLIFTSALFIATTAYAASDSANAEEMAKKLANPIASLISLPIQYNYDSDIGVNDAGDRSTVNIQPVIPFSISEEWNVISRTILPVTSQSNVASGSGSQSGLGDVVQSFFFSPKAPTSNGWILGVGPVFLVPTATDKLLGADKWGIGPTSVALKQEGPWTYGALANHIWSVAGDSARNDVNATFIQPFMSYTTKTATSFVINSESTYDWKSKQWAVPVNFQVTQVLKIGEQLVSVGGGVRYWAESTDTGPEGFGARLIFTFIFPK